jgi:hypothetical protein
VKEVGGPGGENKCRGDDQEKQPVLNKPLLESIDPRPPAIARHGRGEVNHRPDPCSIRSAVMAGRGKNLMSSYEIRKSGPSALPPQLHRIR